MQDSTFVRPDIRHVAGHVAVKVQRGGGGLLAQGLRHLDDELRRWNLGSCERESARFELRNLHQIIERAAHSHHRPFERVEGLRSSALWTAVRRPENGELHHEAPQRLRRS